MADSWRQDRSETVEQQLHAAIWEAIRYLDSPTDYREYLPVAGRPKDDLLIGDSLPRSAWSTVLPLFAIAALIFAILLFVLLM
ncbi:MAG: hypothetical protein ACM3SW_01630 [Actinomycetota bacterium]